jgi:GMP synthase-like glutamine amidotransferase
MPISRFRGDAMQKKFVVINNGGKEDMASIAQSLQASGVQMETIELSKGEPLPVSLENLGGLLILGGPITIYDQDTAPFLKVYFNA